MSQVHAMSDDQVKSSSFPLTMPFSKEATMSNMSHSEALEKAKEIQIKADEEFAIEKSKLVRQETSSIDSTYEKKFKQAAMSQQIARSTVANKTRLRILSSRQELLDGLFEQARGRLGEATKDKKRYEEIVRNLILEGAYALNEDKIQVRARKADYDLVKKASEAAASEYKQNVKKNVQIDIDEANPQPEGSAGGLSIIGGSGKIDINNTFDERLKLLETEALPNIRTTLFGENQNRKFHD
ncbi:MAG: hypothetical protein Q9157_002110 [Trypethelium eluteriae]